MQRLHFITFLFHCITTNSSFPYGALSECGGCQAGYLLFSSASCHPQTRLGVIHTFSQVLTKQVAEGRTKDRAYLVNCSRTASQLLFSSTWETSNHTIVPLTSHCCTHKINGNALQSPRPGASSIALIHQAHNPTQQEVSSSGRTCFWQPHIGS